MRGLIVFSILMTVGVVALILVQATDDMTTQAIIVVVSLAIEAIIWYRLGTAWAMNEPMTRESRNPAKPPGCSAPMVQIRPTGQGGYQPHSDSPVDPIKLTPPTGGSAVQPPRWRR